MNKNSRRSFYEFFAISVTSLTIFSTHLQADPTARYLEFEAKIKGCTSSKSNQCTEKVFRGALKRDKLNKDCDALSSAFPDFQKSVNGLSTASRDQLVPELIKEVNFQYYKENLDTRLQSCHKYSLILNLEPTEKNPCSSDQRTFLFNFCNFGANRECIEFIPRLKEYLKDSEEERIKTLSSIKRIDLSEIQKAMNILIENRLRLKNSLSATQDKQGRVTDFKLKFSSQDESAIKSYVRLYEEKVVQQGLSTFVSDAVGLKSIFDDSERVEKIDLSKPSEILSNIFIIANRLVYIAENNDNKCNDYRDLPPCFHKRPELFGEVLFQRQEFIPVFCQEWNSIITKQNLSYHYTPVLTRKDLTPEERAQNLMIKLEKENSYRVLFSTQRAHVNTKGYVYLKSNQRKIGIQRIPEGEKEDAPLQYDTDIWAVGIGTEVKFAAMKYGFEKNGVRKIRDWIVNDNLASIRLHKKLGFKLVRPGSVHSDYEITREEFEKIKEKYQKTDSGENPFLPRGFDSLKNLSQEAQDKISEYFKNDWVNESKQIREKATPVNQELLSKVETAIKNKSDLPMALGALQEIGAKSHDPEIFRDAYRIYDRLRELVNPEE